MSQYLPQMAPTRRPLVFWLVSTIAVASIVLLIVMAPIAAVSGHSGIAEGIYRGFGIFCHQRPDRSYFIEGHKLAVCSRCTGIYAGFAVTLLIYPLVRSLRSASTPPRKLLFFAALPLLLDFSLTFFGIWENTHTSRLLTGAFLGSVVVFFVMPGIVDLSLRGLRVNTPPGPRFTLACPERIATAKSDYSAPERRI
jgi:uncharacterized membrane protein